MTTTSVDVVALYEALDRKRKNTGAKWREIARELEISPSTFTRLGQGHGPDTNTFLTLLRWLEEPAESFVSGKKGPPPEPEPLTAITSLLRASKKLRPEQAAALSNILEAAYASIVDEER
ncbi:hypothetical protein [Candidatus Amarobacter glycogenicus]|uniref:hypothetical protein n=1 Tax=Candidatus Amarobacter glycogenicus TaxID=3140699 RepID=UPI002A0EFC71|nr:hypothetical protein [Dehalococcoidia bacterium]